MVGLRSVVAGVLLALLLTGCSSGASPDPGAGPGAETSSAAASPSEEPTSEPSASLAPPPRPEVGACYRLDHDDAVAPTSEVPPVGCRKRHTSQTFHVGRLDLEGKGGRTLAVDSPPVQARLAESCARRLGDRLGGARRLSLVAIIWFTPTLEEADAGADWFRCDLVAQRSDGRLLALPRRIDGLLATDEGRGRFGMCGTAAPGTADFTRVACVERHRWQAIAWADIPGRAYPSAARATEAMQDTCRAAARARAEDPLDVAWVEERPSRDQWRAGQRYGLCWVQTS